MKTTKSKFLEVGTVLDGKWAILEFIGKGGMGEVYRAHQLNLKRDVAIKVVSQQWLQSLDGDEAEIENVLQRFRREVQAMAQIRHANILQVHDYGTAAVQKEEEEFVVEYIVMEYIPGATIRFTMSDDGFYPEEDTVKRWLLDYFLPVLDGVQAMHEGGIIHRDLKPENVLMDGETPKIADFGLARSSNVKPMTRSVDMMGSPLYMSPEHFLDFRKADQRADIYSLGKMLFEAVNGKITPETIPFKAASLATQHNPFFKQLDRIIQHATAEDKEERLGSALEFRNDLLAVIEPSKAIAAPDDSRFLGHFSAFGRGKWLWSGVAIATILAASILALGLGHLTSEERPSPVLLNEAQVSGTRIVPLHPSLLPVSSAPHRRFQAIRGEDRMETLVVR
jgi:serine/threonine-protein kinase